MGRCDLGRWIHVVPLRLRSLFRRGRVEQDVDEEIRDHLERAVDALVAQGFSRADALVEARRSFGGVAQRMEECRDARRLNVIDDAVADVRYGVRVLRKTPSFTTVAVLSLALGIGANTAIFHLIDVLRLRPLPVTKPHELAIVQIENWNWPPGDYSGRYAGLTHPLWQRLRAQQQAFSGIFAWGNTTFDLSTSGESRFAENALWVSGEFFSVLGVTPHLGRLFTAADDTCAAPGVVLSHAFWRREFGGAHSIVGRPLSLNGHPLEIVGVAREGFYGIEVGRSFDVAVPLCADILINGAEHRLAAPRAWWLSAVGRLKPNRTLDEASAHLRTLSPAMFADAPTRYNADAARNYRRFRLGALPGAFGYSNLRQEYNASLWLILAVAAVVLLIACANLANLMLARAITRDREIAVRLALGASRGRVIRQLLVESLLLAIAGAVCAGLLAPTLSRAVVAMISSPVDPLFVDLTTDWRVLAFMTGLALATCVLFGLAPAVRATRHATAESVRGAAWLTTRSPVRSGLRRALVVVQVGLSLVLLVGGLLFVRSLNNLLDVDAGFEMRGVLEVDVDMARAAIPPERRAATFTDLLARIRALPGVDAAATASRIPLVGRSYSTVYMDGSSVQEMAQYNRVSAGYFRTMKTALVAGRDFDDRDRPTSTAVAIVNDAFVRRFLNGASPLGRTFRLEGPSGRPEREFQIVGRVGDTKYASLRDPFSPTFYLAESQDPRPTTSRNILLRSSVPLDAMMASVKHTIEGASPAVSFHFHDFAEQIGYSLLADRLMAALCGFFAALAAVVATSGVYGLMSYSVTQRTNEIGIRLALGASGIAIRRMVLREASVLVALGVAMGVALTIPATSAARTLLFELTPRDPITMGAAIVVRVIAAGAASYLPARRASRVDPMTALRCD